MPRTFKRLSIAEARHLLNSKECSSVELTRAHLKRIEEVEPKLGALTNITADRALSQAEEADKLIAQGKAGTLTGIPAIIKDNICTKGIKTTCSSRMLADFVPPYDAHVMERLHEAGIVMVGKANLDEFAMGSSTEHSAFYTTRNPWDLERVPGGSSGGSAAAMAAGEAVYSLGSDTGGSIRLPASFCGISGFKPTYSRVSRYGLVAFASSLDQIGPLAEDALGCAEVLNVISGYDLRDSTSSPQDPTDYTANLNGGIKGMRLGVPQEYLVEGMQAEVADIFKKAIADLEGLGAEVDFDVSLPHTSHALAVYYIIAPSEASANLARYDGVKYGFRYEDAESMWDAMEKTREDGFGAEVKRRIMLGTYALSAGYYDAWYLKAQKVRTLIRQEFDQAFTKYDALITPTAPTTPFKIGEKTTDPLQMYLSDVCTLPINIAGLPGISIPAGFAEGLPVGMQIIGKPFAEETILKIAHAYQGATDWHKRTPSI